MNDFLYFYDSFRGEALLNTHQKTIAVLDKAMSQYFTVIA